MIDQLAGPTAAPPTAGAASGAAAPANGGPDAAAAKQFEAMMMTQMLESMFAGVSTKGPFDGGFAEESFRGLLLEAVGGQIAAGTGVGIAEHVRAQIAAYQSAKEG